jgi:hypothetical protein
MSPKLDPYIGNKFLEFRFKCPSLFALGKFSPVGEHLAKQELIALEESPRYSGELVLQQPPVLARLFQSLFFLYSCKAFWSMP